MCVYIYGLSFSILAPVIWRSRCQRKGSDLCSNPKSGEDYWVIGIVNYGPMCDYRHPSVVMSLVERPTLVQWIKDEMGEYNTPSSFLNKTSINNDWNVKKLPLNMYIS